MIVENLLHTVRAIKGKTASGLLLLFVSVMSPGILSAAGMGELDAYIGRDSTRTADERFLVMPYAGVVFYGNLDPQPNTGFYEGLPRPSSVLIGMRGSMFLTDWLAGELSISRSSTENVHKLLYDDPDLLLRDPPAPPVGIQTLRNSVSPIVRLGGNLLYRPPLDGAVKPHLTAGLGWVHYSARKEVSAEVAYFEYDIHRVDTTSVTEDSVRVSGWSSVSIDLGGGLSGRITRVLSARMDVEFHFSKFSPLDVDGPLTGKVFYARSQWVRDLELSAGLVFRF